MKEKERGQLAATTEMDTVGGAADTEAFIRDADAVEELMELVKASLLAESGISMLAQANVSTMGVKLLLRRSENQ